MRFNSTLDDLGLDWGLLAWTEWAADDVYVWSSIVSVRTQPENNFESELGTPISKVYGEYLVTLWWIYGESMLGLWRIHSMDFQVAASHGAGTLDFWELQGDSSGKTWNVNEKKTMKHMTFNHWKMDFQSSKQWNFRKTCGDAIWVDYLPMCLWQESNLHNIGLQPSGKSWFHFLRMSRNKELAQSNVFQHEPFFMLRSNISHK